MTMVKSADGPRHSAEIPVDAPPDYDETLTSPADVVASQQPPSDAQRAQAPLRVIQTNTSIKDDYLLLRTEGSRDHLDVFLNTTNARISSGVWIEGSWGRRLNIEAKSTNARVDLAVHTLVDGQPLNVTTTSTNAGVSLALPVTFHGHIVLQSTNSSRNLSPLLQRRSVRVPVQLDDEKSAERYEIGGPGGTDSAMVKSTNASVTAKYVTEVEPSWNAKGGANCVLM